MSSTAYGSAAPTYRDSGWPGVLPLPTDRKDPPPPGFTGKSGADPTADQIEDWVAGKPYRATIDAVTQWINPANIALRLPDGIIGYDLDAYKPEGRVTHDAFVAKCGELPRTWVSTSRTDGSGIAFFRIPPGVKLRGAFGGIEVVQHGHRYAVVAPSVHPEGRIYRWITPDGEISDTGPRPEQLPELPDVWLQALREPDPASNGDRPAKSRSTGEWARCVRDAFAEAVAANGSRHDAATAGALALARFEDLDYPGAGEALESLGASFRARILDRPCSPAEAEAEWRRIIDSARTKVRSTPATIPRWEDSAEFHQRAQREWQDEIEQMVPQAEAAASIPAAAAAPATAESPPAEPTWQERFDFPDPPHEAAFYGLAGQLVELLGPHTEGGEIAILGQFMAAFGNAIGRRPYFQVGGDRHRTNLYIGVVGDSGKGRKGSGLSVALVPVERADPSWSANAKAFGLSTGEGIIHHLRDPKINDKGEEYDGARDKRLFAVETEFSRVLKVAGRENSILSMVLRQGWDGQTLQTMTKTSPERASDALLSLVAHTTRADLRRHLDDVDVLNGFANRFIWLASRRSRILPDGGGLDPHDVDELTTRAARALAAARDIDGVTRTPGAQKLWKDAYELLTAGRSGALGAVLGRADAQVLRLSLVYAMTDGSKVITEEHLRAALALWEYAERSAMWIFGWSTGNRQADVILSDLRAAYPGTMTRDKIRNQLGRNHPVDEPLSVLAEQHLAERMVIKTGERGRPSQHWWANPVPPPIGFRAFSLLTQQAETDPVEPVDPRGKTLKTPVDESDVDLTESHTCAGCGGPLLTDTAVICWSCGLDEL